jgi:hypothetical protein
MSRGLGRVQRGIVELLESNPDEAFTVDRIAEHVYPDADEIEKRHRVAILRAFWGLKPEIHAADWDVGREQHRLVFYNKASTASRTRRAELKLDGGDRLDTVQYATLHERTKAYVANRDAARCVPTTIERTGEAVL